jgi:hypothetical protein
MALFGGGALAKRFPLLALFGGEALVIHLSAKSKMNGYGIIIYYYKIIIYYNYQFFFLKIFS